MPNLTASIPHQLSRTEAKRRIQEKIAEARQQHATYLSSLQETWDGDRLTFAVSALGQSVNGHLTVEDQVVHLEIALPLFLSFLAGAVKQQIEQQGHLLLAGPSR